MKSRYSVILATIALCLTSCNKTYRPNDYELFANIPVYSEIIESIDYTAMVTGVNAPVDTKARWKIGGTDLGFPYYDEKSKNMFYLFGDTFAEVRSSSSLFWRSNVLGYSRDLDLSNGISFDGFIIDDSQNMAKEVIPSPHNPNGVGGEITAIPTGGIIINDNHYVFVMSINEWLEVGWDVNYCACWKSTDGGKTFAMVPNLLWNGSSRAKRLYTEYRCEITYEGTAAHINDNFMQIFPYQINDYVYIMGIPSGRFGGAKLGRVKIDKFEDFTAYEYYTGKDEEGTPLWEKGTLGLQALIENDDSYVVEPQVGEPGISYSTYFGKHMLSYYSNNKIVFRLSENLIDWSDYVIVATSEEFKTLYGGFTHQKFEQKQGKIQYFLVSQYYVKELGDNQYNVKLLKVTFK